MKIRYPHKRMQALTIKCPHGMKHQYGNVAYMGSHFCAVDCPHCEEYDGELKTVECNYSEKVQLYYTIEGERCDHKL